MGFQVLTSSLYPGPLPDDNPLSTGGATPRKIRLEFPATTVVNFLDIASVSTPTVTTDYDGTVKLLKLADRLRAYKLISHLKALLYVHVESRPLDMLVLASDRNDLEMGQKAIAKLDSNHVKSLRSRPGGFGRFYGELRPEWRHHLMELILFASYQRGKLLTSWDTLYSKFDPPEVPVAEVVEEAPGPSQSTSDTRRPE